MQRRTFKEGTTTWSEGGIIKCTFFPNGNIRYCISTWKSSMHFYELWLYFGEAEGSSQRGRDKTICSSCSQRSRRLRDQIRTSRRPSDSFPLWMGFLPADRWKKMQPDSSQQECVGDPAGEEVIGRDKRSPFQGKSVWFLFWINFGSNVLFDKAWMYSWKTKVRKLFFNDNKLKKC